MTGTAGSRAAGAATTRSPPRWSRLQRFPQLYGGLLCTIDLSNDPVRTYRALADFDPPKIDFLMPHGTWEEPPPGRIPGDRQHSVCGLAH